MNFCLLTTQAGCSHLTQLETTGELLIGKPELVSDYCFNRPIHLERRIGISARHTLFARIDIRSLLHNDIICWNCWPLLVRHPIRLRSALREMDGHYTRASLFARRDLLPLSISFRTLSTVKCGWTYTANSIWSDWDILMTTGTCMGHPAQEKIPFF